MKLIYEIIVAALIGGVLALSPVQATPFHRTPVLAVPTPPSGISQENIGNNDFSGNSLTNILKASAFDYGFSGSNTPQMYDANQYPQTAISSLAQGAITGMFSGQEYKLSWPATRSVCKFNFSGPTLALVAKSTTATVSGFGSSNTTITCDGSNAGFVQFTCNTGTCANWNFQTPAGSTYASGSGEWILCRDANNGGAPNDDCSQYALAVSTGGKQGSFFTREYISALTGADFAWIRSMGAEANYPASGQSGSQSIWGYRPQVGWMTWARNNPYRVPSALAGGAANTNSTLTSSTGGAGQAPIILTAAPSDDQNAGLNSGSLGAWADGEAIIATTPTPAVSGFYVGSVISDGTTNCSSGPCVVLGLGEAAAQASNAGTTLTVASSQNTATHPITVGQTVFGQAWTTATVTGSALSNPTACAPNCTGSGGAGTYAVSVSQTVASGANNTYFVTPSDVSSVIAANNVVFGAQITGTTEANGVQTVSSVSGFQLTTATKFVHSGFSPASSQTCLGIQQLVVTGKSGAGVFIMSPQGTPYGGCNNTNFTLPASTVTAFVYSSAVGATVAGTTGFPASMPWEAIINLSNVANMNMWANFPPQVNNTYIAGFAALTAANLNSNLSLLTEYSNEIWDNSQNTFWLVSQMAWGLGIAQANFDELTFQGLRSGMISTLMKANGWSSRSGYLAGMFNQEIAVSNYQSRMWNGAGLAVTNNAALCAFEGGTFSGTCSGAVDYSAVGTRPVDEMDVQGQAPYANGNCLGGADFGPTFGTSCTLWYEALINKWILNDNTDQNAAIQLVDYDMRGQTWSNNPTGNSNPNYTLTSCTGSPGTWNFSTSVAGTNNSSTFSFTTTGAYPNTLTAANSAIGSSPGVYILSSGAGTSAIQLKSITNGVVSTSAIGCGTGGSGTLTMYSNNLSSTMLAKSTYYACNSQCGGWFNYDAALASYTTARAAFTPPKAPIQYDWYEGALENQAAFNFQATLLSNGITATPAITPITGTSHGTAIVDSVAVNGTPGVQGIAIGQTVSAADITASQTVASINTGCTAPCFTLSAVASGSNAGETITFTDPAALAAFNAINNVTFGWKNSSLGKATMIAYYKGFLGTDSAQPWTYSQMQTAKAPSNLILAQKGGITATTPSSWSLYPGDITTTPFQTYNGVCDFNGGSC